MPAAVFSQPPPFLRLLAHELRWRLVEALGRGDRRVHELVELLGEPANLVSYHLRQLRGQALVRGRRGAADGRDVYYSLDLDRVRALYLASAESLHPGLAERKAGTADGSVERKAGAADGAGETSRRIRVLFLCTHNSARSQMAEGILRALGGKRVDVASAGTEATRVHPLAVREMAARGIDIGGQRSKHLNEFIGERFDFVVTVCDRARESCPIFPGDPERVHWSIADPAAVEGAKPQQDAFKRAADELTTRIRYLLALLEKERR
jgi:protein-tyrosine-phosphatase